MEQPKNFDFVTEQKKLRITKIKLVDEIAKLEKKLFNCKIYERRFYKNLLDKANNKLRYYKLYGELRKIMHEKKQKKMNLEEEIHKIENKIKDKYNKIISQEIEKETKNLRKEHNKIILSIRKIKISRNECFCMNFKGQKFPTCEFCGKKNYIFYCGN